MLNFDADSPDDLEPIAPFPDDKIPLDSPIPDETEDETEIAEDDEVDDESDTTLTQ